LAYAKAVAEAHGGSIDEIGGPAQGAHFVVWIPLTQEQTP
jgi:signal transduction histidine kinase